MRRFALVVILLLIFTALPVSAHANLSRSEPAANAVLAESPTEIRLWFTEPLETNFSRIRLQGSSGATLELGASQVDETDPYQMFLTVSDLPDGVYTVVWQVVSAADGHPLNGNYPFTIGEAEGGAAAASELGTFIPIDSVLIRWFHLLSLSLTIGSVGFWLFVWQPTMTDEAATKRLFRLIWIGWVLLGVANILILMLYVSSITGASLLDTLFDPSLPHALSTRYGQLWMARAALWLILELVLFQGRKDKRFLWGALGIGAIITIVHGYSSHASAAPDQLAAVLIDALHVFATALWVGGLVQFINTLLWMKQRGTTPEADTTPLVSTLVKYFSNYVRVAVLLLIVSGTYTAWLQVGSINALLTTTYGQALLIKLILFAPLLLTAGVNLVFTSRGLSIGNGVWVGRLRGLVGAEIALVIAILVAAGVLTAINTGRAVAAQRQALIVEPHELVTMQITNEYHAHMEIYPGWVGQNTFNLGLYDIRTSTAVNDATLVRLRFQNMSQNVGTSELRPTFVNDGLYTATGANFSTPGRWRIRMTLQRPDMFDTVLDFTITVGTAPPPPTIDMTIPPMERVTALVLAGAFCLGIGGFVTAEKRFRLLNGAGLLAVSAVVVGVILLVSGVQLMSV